MGAIDSWEIFLNSLKEAGPPPHQRPPRWGSYAVTECSEELDLNRKNPPANQQRECVQKKEREWQSERSEDVHYDPLVRD